VLHVAVLPALMILLTIVHFWRVRKDGGLSRPVWKLKAERRKSWSPSARRRRQRRCKPRPASKDKTYGLMEVVTGKPIFETSDSRRGRGHGLLLSLRLCPRGRGADGDGHHHHGRCRCF
jgi:hypothetical protein